MVTDFAEAVVLQGIAGDDFVILPASHARTMRAMAALEGAATHDRPTVLVVDDDPMVHTLVRHGLRELDPERVLTATDGVAAQQLLRETAVDIVITDVLMPEMDGRELMAWAQEHCPDPLWIVLSGLDTFDTAVDALHLGAFDFLPKPPDAHRLRVSVRNAMQQIELERAQQYLNHELERSNAELAERVTQLQELCQVLENQAEIIHTDLQRAAVIQKALLPTVPPHLPGWTLRALYRAGSNHVGGDFFDVFRLGGQNVGLVIADAAGHGVAAAMLSVLFKLALEVTEQDSDEPLPPANVLARLNDRLMAQVRTPGLFVSAVYVLLDLATGDIRMASAGHPPAMWVDPSGEPKRLVESGPALGLSAGSQYTDVGLTLAADGRLVLFTDGILGGTKQLDYDAIEALLVDADGDDLPAGLYERATETGDGDVDDVTVLFLSRRAGDSLLDVGTNEVPADAPVTASASVVELSEGSASESGFITIAGKGTWIESQSFYDSAVALLERYGRLVVDLANCERLDSTFLGTVHQLVVEHPAAVTLQRVAGKVLDDFHELSLDAVMERVRDEPAALPGAMRPVTHAAGQDVERQQRILSAHELLASLSKSNQGQFKELVETLRRELD